MKLIKIKESSIHGKGIFAAKDIPNETLIGHYTGKKTYENDTYVLWITDENDHEYGIDGDGDLKYLNHSAKPNACFYDYALYAENEIKKGEEITFHYGDDFEEYINSLEEENV